KGLVFSPDKLVALCAPLTIQDIQSLYEQFFVSDPSRPVDTRSIPWLGAITLAATKKTPVLIILPSERFGPEQPQFITFDQVRAISDEVSLGVACSFILHLEKQDLKFLCKTSTDYQNWIKQLTAAFEMAAEAYDAQANDMKRKATYVALQERHHILNQPAVEETLGQRYFS
ncbi:hypothetical protein EDD86DRAFT_254327, partial [Gorgonomyces haynaldii]